MISCVVLLASPDRNPVSGEEGGGEEGGGEDGEELRPVQRHFAHNSNCGQTRLGC